jgi:hypothetical protein
LEKLEKEVTALLELAAAFFEEGRELDRMREHLDRFVDQMRRLEDVKEFSVEEASKVLLKDIEDLKTNLEISSDREEKFKRIVSDLHDLEKKWWRNEN